MKVTCIKVKKRFQTKLNGLTTTSDCFLYEKSHWSFIMTSKRNCIFFSEGAASYDVSPPLLHMKPGDKLGLHYKPVSDVIKVKLYELDENGNMKPGGITSPLIAGEGGEGMAVSL